MITFENGNELLELFKIFAAHSKGRPDILIEASHRERPYWCRIDRLDDLRGYERPCQMRIHIMTDDGDDYYWPNDDGFEI